MFLTRGFFRQHAVVLFVCALLLGSVFLFLQVFSEGVSVVITEICPTGCGSKDHQWIEIYNAGSESVDLSDWKFFEAETNHGLKISASSTIQDMILESGAYAVIVQNDLIFFQDYPDVSVVVLDSSWGTLNKSGEEIGLKNVDGDVVELFTYKEIEQHSLERIDVLKSAEEEINWKEHPDGTTVGKHNYWMGQNSDPEPEENKKPVAQFSMSTSSIFVDQEIIFSAVSSTDEDGSIESYEWFFNDVEINTNMIFSHVFSSTGTVQVLLQVTDDKGAVATTTQDIVVLSDDEPDVPPDVPVVTTTDYIILINEFVSDPVAGESEWIELYNHTSTSVDITDWELHEGSGTSTKKLKTVEGNLPAYGYVVITLTSSKLNNSGDVIVLFDNEKNEIDRVTYGDWDDGDVEDNAPESSDPYGVARVAVGQDTGNDKNDFALTTTLTPSEENEIVEPVLEAEESSSDGGGGSTAPVVSVVIYNVRDVVVNELITLQNH